MTYSLPTHSNIPIGRVSFSCEQLVVNTLAAMKGISTHIPGGTRNIQSVHLKTPDSISLPIYHSLPPPPALLPAATDQGPPTKRVKFDTNNDATNSDTCDITASSRKRKNDIPLERCLDFDGDNLSEGEKESLPVIKKKLSKLSVKKVRGSTVRSSKYEKALRRKAKS